MARKRPATVLTRTFERSAAPIYILGADRHIEYVNEACAVWMGVECERLIGTQCKFTSEKQSNKIDEIAAGLCPPPEIFAFHNQAKVDQSKDGVCVGGIDFHIRSSSKEPNNVWRQAVAMRIDDNSSTATVLVIADTTDLAEIPSPSETDKTSEALHLALAEIRKQSELAFHADSVIGNSPVASRLRRQSKVAAECTADLLIMGPPGSGREHLARTIHAMRPSSQNAGMLTPIECSVADQDQIQNSIETILRSQKSNRSNDDQSPTPWLLLLNVDQLGINGQLKLLQYLQNPEFPLRIVATTSADLVEISTTGGYASELARYLNGLAIELVKLSERSSDIPLLAQSIVERSNDRLAKSATKSTVKTAAKTAAKTADGNRPAQISGIAIPAIQLLQEYHWPGNIDQLSEIVNTAVDQASGTKITADDLPKKFHDLLRAARLDGPAETEIDLDGYLQTIEKELIRRAIQQSKGNKTKAAKLLKISRAKLLRRIQYFELEIGVDVDSPAETLDSSAFEEID